MKLIKLSHIPPTINDTTSLTVIMYHHHHQYSSSSGVGITYVAKVIG